MNEIILRQRPPASLRQTPAPRPDHAHGWVVLEQAAFKFGVAVDVSLVPKLGAVAGHYKAVGKVRLHPQLAVATTLELPG